LVDDSRDEQPSNLRAIDSPLPDAAVVEVLEETLEAARRGEVIAVVMVVARRDGSWQNRLCGDTSYHSLAGLNLRVDMMKRLLLQQVRINEAEGEG
jgi:hypothetical protein